MKLHLPSSLRRSLMLSFFAVLAVTCAGVVEAAYQHQDVSIKTYTDFGQNKGRYVVGNTNALLQYLNKDGVKITYTGGQSPYTLEHGMIDFDSQVSSGEAAAIGYNFIATVNHVAVVDEHYNNGLMDFTRNSIGRSNSVLYTGIEYTGSTAGTFLLKPSQDYKVTRLSKLVTDVTGSTVYGSVDGDYSGISEASLAGDLLYRAGSGHMYHTWEDGSRSWCANPYTYITGGIDTIQSIPTNTADGCYSLFTYFTYAGDEVGQSEPLPYKADQGDSGSPSWVWNEHTQQYEYIAALQSGNEYNMSQFRGNCEWTNNTMASFDVSVMAGSGDSAIYLNAITGEGALVEDSASGVSAKLHYGLVTDADGNELARYNGVQNGKETWKNLAELKDTDNWYNYGDKYLNATKEASSSADLTWAELFHNNNLVISASSDKTQEVVLRDTVDLGIGYVQFSLGAAGESAEFVVSSEEGEGNLLHSAGYVVDKGVSVHLQLTNPSTYMREWRKVGEGALYIEGSGDNAVYLNLGGDGVTYLRRTGGYAAYNVLANNGTTVVIDSINQIARDLTFGNRGGVLDMNGHSMVWNNDNGAGAEGFTIHALDEGAIIANRAEGTHTTLTWTQSGTQTWKGSFADTESSALTFVYNGGGTLTMHSILTSLQHADSGMEVKSGKVTLVGTNTVHALGSQGAWNSSARYSSSEDWHYADAAMDVSVEKGATFELGSHARLTGDVTVEEGGTYIMREGVKHRYEFIEGGYVKEDTDAIRAFFGHKGNVSLASGATMQVAFNGGTDSTLVYGGDISGAGSVTVNAQSGILKLGGTNTFSGTKVLTQGGLWAASDSALGDTTTNKWKIGEQAWLASDGFTEATKILSHIDSSSTGVLALSQNVEGQLDLSGHTGLIIGAAEGCDVRYGTEDESLSAVNGQWVLGGGGGHLEVAFKLSGDNNLLLGNTYGKGNVHLSNADNDFSGVIRYVGGVTLSYEEGALGNAMIDLSYGNRALLVAADIRKVQSSVQGVSQGVVLVDRMAGADVDLSAHTGLALASSGDVIFSGNISLAEGNPYRFGGGDGCLTVTSTLASGCDMVIDGQGYTGGSVVLSNAQNFNGHVAIMGGTGAGAGDVTLRFTADNSLSGARAFTISNGGIIDLAGTNQQLAGVELVSGGMMTDSSAERTSTLTLTSGSIGSGGVVNVAHVVKAGAGTLTLNNSTNFSDFAVTGGTLKLAAAAKGAFRVEGSGVMDMGRCDVSGTVALGSGATLKNVSGLSAAVHVQGDSSLSGSSIELKGALTLDEGATLSVDGGSSALTVSKNSSLHGAGQLRISSSSNRGYSDVSIDGDNSAFTGRLAISGMGSNVVNFASVNAFGAGTVALDNIAFSASSANTATTAVASTLEVGANGTTFRGGVDTYYFTHLSGGGTLRSAQCGDGTMWFAGNVSGFSGTLADDSSNLATDTLRFGFGGSGVNYHNVTGNGNTAEAAVLFGKGARLTSSNATVTYEFNYADRVALNATVEGHANVTQSGAGTLVLDSANTSTGVLTINSGAVELAEGSAWTGSLAGSGTLVATSDEAITIASASAFTGSLEMVMGSKLSLGESGAESFSLGAGQHLSVLAGAAGSKESATLNVSSLVLNGGTLAFSGEAMANDGGALLYLPDATVSSGSVTSISFFDTAGLAASQYALLQGNLSGVSGSSFIATGLDDCFSATFSVQNKRLLLVTLSTASGNKIWSGSGTQNSWISGFGGTAPGAEDAVWFNDTAEAKMVSISGVQEAARLVFNSTEDYSLTTNDGGTLKAVALELRGSGKVTLGSGITISKGATLTAGSELVIQDFSILNDTVSGAGTLTIDTGAGAGSESLSGLDTLKLVSGCYVASSMSIADHIVVEGGQFFLQNVGSATYSGDICLAGDGWIHDTKESVNGAALRVSGTTVLKGDITLDSHTAVAVDGTTYLQGSLVGQGKTLTKKGAGTLWLDTANGFDLTGVSFVVQEGGLRLGRYVSNALPEGITSLTVDSGAWLGLQSNSGSVAGDVILRDKATLDLASGVTNTTSKEYTFTGKMELSGGEATLTTSMARKLTLDGVVSGAGGLKIEGSGSLELVLNNAGNSFEGGIVIERAGVSLTLGNAAAAGTGAIVLGNASAQMSVAGNVDGSYGVMSNAVSGSGSVEVGSGRVAMTGSHSYTGGTTVKTGAVLRLAAANTGSSNYVVENGATLELEGDASLSVGEVVTLRARNTASPALARAAVVEGHLENVTVTDTALSSSVSDSLGLVSNASVCVDGSEYTLSQLELSGSEVQVSSRGALLTLEDLFIDASSSISGLADDVTLALQNVTLEVEFTSLSDGVGYGLGGNTIASYSLTNFSNVSLTGNLQFNVSSVAAPQGTDYIAIVFDDSVNVSAIRASVNFDDGAMLVSSSGSGDSSVLLFATPSSDAVPEPTTGALTLMGLGALALRRRRR